MPIFFPFLCVVPTICYSENLRSNKYCCYFDYSNIWIKSDDGILINMYKFKISTVNLLDEGENGFLSLNCLPFWISFHSYHHFACFFISTIFKLVLLFLFTLLSWEPPKCTSWHILLFLYTFFFYININILFTNNKQKHILLLSRIWHDKICFYITKKNRNNSMWKIVKFARNNTEKNP